MRELNGKEIETVSGASLTSQIMDFFKQFTTSTSKEKTDWVRPEDIPESHPVSGSTFGLGIVGLATAAAAVVIGFLTL
ncbi:hypothetical protein [Pantoea sp. KPR_PJ]|uniref:hypothetical protein n=1 Tax=Pantoea sp. KPR_PJ TaxID=2738375 RepID=UPI003527ADE8